MKDTLPITFIKPPAGAIPISWEIADALGVRDGDRRFDIETRGPWHMVSKCRGIRMTSKFNRSPGYTITDAVTVWGPGTLSSPRESGYQLEGRSSVPVFGKVRAFTSSQLFELPDGKLRDCCEIFCCVYSDKVNH
jgi:hypothetical protein